MTEQGDDNGAEDLTEDHIRNDSPFHTVVVRTIQSPVIIFTVFLCAALRQWQLGEIHCFDATLV